MRNLSERVALESEPAFPDFVDASDAAWINPALLYQMTQIQMVVQMVDILLLIRHVGFNHR